MKRYRLIIFLVCLLLSACTSVLTNTTPTQPALSIDAVRGPRPASMQTHNIHVSREKYKVALAKEGSVNSARFIEIYQRGKTNDQLKEYRLLDVQPDSIYALIGLEHSDIIVATDGYVVPTAQVFWSYLHLITNFKEGNIEIRRKDQPQLIQYKFID